jgi:threonine/homoserine/homoserine lactone efflux protein
VLATTTLIVLIGVALGIFSAIVPLGPVTVLVLRRAMAGESSGALRLGMGRVPAETFYCALATFGIVALLDRFPGARASVEVLGTLVFLAVGVWLLVQRSTPAPASGSEAPTAAEASPREGPGSGRWRGPDLARARRWGDWSGFIISMLNPTLLLSWSAMVGVAVSMGGLAPTLLDKIAFPLALGSGIALGYVILVEVLRRYGERVEHAWVQRAIQAMGGVFVGLSLWNGGLLLGWL